MRDGRQKEDEKECVLLTKVGREETRKKYSRGLEGGSGEGWK
jgi:hypothetical protein